jgi:hypothetical protein
VLRAETAPLAALAALTLVVALHAGNARLEARVPLRPAQALGVLVLGIRFPGGDGGEVRPVRHRDAQALARRLHAQKAGLLRGQLHHALGHGAITLVALGAQAGEDHRVIRRRGGVGEAVHLSAQFSAHLIVPSARA